MIPNYRWQTEANLIRWAWDAGYETGRNEAFEEGPPAPRSRKGPTTHALRAENDDLKKAAQALTRSEAALRERVAALEAEVAALKADLATRPPAPVGMAMVPQEASRLTTKRFRHLEFD